MSMILATASALPLAVAAWRDFATRTVPDACGLVLAGFGVGLRTADGPSALVASVAMTAVLFVPLLLLHARGMLGGGDVKLLLSFVLGLSPSAAAFFLFWVVMAGGALGVLYLLLGRLLPAATIAAAGRRRPPLARVLTVEAWRIRRRAPYPYAVAIALGGVVFLARQGG